MIRKALIFIFIIGLISCQVIKKEDRMEYKTLDFDGMWNYNDPAATEQKFMTILDTIDVNAPDYDRSYHLQLLTQLARTKGLQGQFEEGHEFLERVSEVLDESTNIARIRYLLEKGRLFNSSGVKDSARVLFKQAWQFGNEQGLDFYSLDAAHMMGIVEPPEKQLEWNLKALEIARNSPDKRVKNWLGPLYNNIGWTYHDQGNYLDALRLFEQDLAWRKEIGDDGGARISRWSVARANRSLGKLDTALDIQLDLEREIRENELPEDGYVYEELAELYLLKNEKGKAADYFKLAHDLLSQDPWLQKNEPERLKRLREMSTE